MGSTQGPRRAARQSSARAAVIAGEGAPVPANVQPREWKGEMVMGDVAAPPKPEPRETMGKVQAPPEKPK